MSNQIPTLKVNSFQPTLELLVQQKGSKILRNGAVRMETQDAEIKFFDRIGVVEAQLVVGRSAKTKHVDTPHDRRGVTVERYTIADLIDPKDQLETLADPTGKYMQSQMAGLGRQIDDVVIAKHFGTAITGKTGTGTATFPATQVVPAEYVETGSDTDSDLTIGKIRRAINILEDNEVELDFEKGWLGYTPNQKQSLLRTTEVTSADFNTVRTLVDGKINTFLGLEFITWATKRLLTKTGTGVGSNVTSRRIPVWVTSGMILSMDGGVKSRIDTRKDLNMSQQVFSEVTAGSVRTEEEKVVEIECFEG